MAARKGFREAYCSAAAACLSKGYGLEVLAADLDVSRSTVFAWMKTHPCFAEAVARGRAQAAVAAGQGVRAWRAAYCGAAVQCLGKGYSLGVLAAELGVGLTTLRGWMKAHPEFAAAVARGRALAAAARPVGRGRPTGWREEHCRTAEAVLGRGYSLRVVAAELGVCRHTVVNWMRAHPEFAAAVGRGGAAGARVWEDRLAAAASGTSRGRPSAITFALRALFPEDWAGRVEDAEAAPRTITVEFVRPGDVVAEG